MRNDLSTFPWPWKKPNAGFKEAVELKKPEGRAIRCSVIERIPCDGFGRRKIHFNGRISSIEEKKVEHRDFLIYSLK